MSDKIDLSNFSKKKINRLSRLKSNILSTINGNETRKIFALPEKIGEIQFKYMGKPGEKLAELQEKSNNSLMYPLDKLSGGRVSQFLSDCKKKLYSAYDKLWDRMEQWIDSRNAENEVKWEAEWKEITSEQFPGFGITMVIYIVLVPLTLIYLRRSRNQSNREKNPPLLPL